MGAAYTVPGSKVPVVALAHRVPPVQLEIVFVLRNKFEAI